ncbi:MBL fold metallo-hydrolase [Candidatus Poribacteria bacterium]|jgi:L-ascorbate 6-phosphate lactonase|nr:MBL fold metallo-hydrolase [Candidatus Poribacteria bacterium]MBT7100437.1 MBL fold metallo-hydrolase [Candidatus Poribacteria bacterium]MBT7804697.1 MBL fold metallo-hydrolase [Candidatus Poribacteria bacterium]
MLQHEALLADVTSYESAPGSVAFWWMGQHSFIVRLGNHTIYIDPYLTPSDSRRTPPLLRPDEVTNADIVLCTHDHGDHIDPGAVPGIAAASPEAFFVAPRTARQRMLDLEVDPVRLVSLDAEDTYVAEGIRVTAVKGKHEFFDRDEALGYPYLGYVIEAGDVTVYHAGDTILYDGLIATLAPWRIDVAFLPINGRDARRLKANCLGNFTFQEAVDVAGDIEAGYAVPTHYEMFEFNSADPQDFVDYLAVKFPAIRTWVGEPGTRVVVDSGH